MVTCQSLCFHVAVSKLKIHLHNNIEHSYDKLLTIILYNVMYIFIFWQYLQSGQCIHPILYIGENVDKIK